MAPFRMHALAVMLAVVVPSKARAQTAQPFAAEEQQLSQQLAKQVTELFSAPPPPPLPVDSDRLADDLAKSLTDAFGNLPTPPSAPKAAAPATTPEPPRPTPARPAQPSVATAVPMNGRQKNFFQVGPLVVELPASWAVAKPHETGIIFGPNGTSAWDKVVSVMRHDGFRNAAYTPAGIARAIVGDASPEAILQRVNVGFERLPGVSVLRGRNGRNEFVLFEAANAVYMISTQYQAGDQTTRNAFQSAVQSVKVGDLKQELADAPQKQTSKPTSLPTNEPTQPAAKPHAAPTAQAKLKDALAKLNLPATLPPGGEFLNTFLGVNLNGSNDRQCVSVAFDLSRQLYGIAPPAIGYQGAAVLMNSATPTPGFAKIAASSGGLPPPGSLLVWNTSVGGGQGHVGLVVQTNPAAHAVRVVDSNWVGNFVTKSHPVAIKYAGGIRDVDIRSPSISGWLVRQP